MVSPFPLCGYETKMREAEQIYRCRSSAANCHLYVISSVTTQYKIGELRIVDIIHQILLHECLVVINVQLVSLDELPSFWVWFLTFLTAILSGSLGVGGNGGRIVEVEGIVVDYIILEVMSSVQKFEDNLCLQLLKHLPQFSWNREIKVVAVRFSILRREVL
ncbi:hypothetical protein S83_044942 [Arachis hypogaea]|nr:uncharacterized protein DS421_13g433660 [Arachis hypogaea]